MSVISIKNKIRTIEGVVSSINDPGMNEALTNICDALKAIAKELDEHEEAIRRLKR